MFYFSPTSLDWLILIEPQVHTDERGFFMEVYSHREFMKNDIEAVFVQHNHSKTKQWVVRGLHFQTINTQSKLIRVIAGSIYDVALDLRKSSPTYGQYFGIVLSEENNKKLFIPKGFAHGFLSLEEDTEVIYSCDDYYNPVWNGGIFYNDTDLNIDWGSHYEHDKIIISEQDSRHPRFRDFQKNNPF